MTASADSKAIERSERNGHPDSSAERSITDWFRRAAHVVTLVSGSWQFFLFSVIGITGWALLGPPMDYSDTWQLLVNTPTTVLTYLLGILILMEANRQSKESKVVHDEMLRAMRTARNELVDVDEMTEEQLDRVEHDIRARARREGRRGKDVGTLEQP